MYGNSFVFHFEGSSKIELVSVETKLEHSSRPYTCYRGKTSGAYLRCGSFQWTSGVRGVCAAFLRFLLSEGNDVVDYCLIGGKSSLAASLDYALSKGPAWLGEMFGYGIGNHQNARRIFKTTNPNRKRPGPVAISVNRHMVSAQGVQIYWEGKRVTDSKDLYAILIGIEEQGCRGQDGTSHGLSVLKATVNL